jgi:membrane fusion protein, multidrug efflux system
MAEQSSPTPATPPATLRDKRKRWLTIVVASFVAIALVYGAYWAIDLRDKQSTDDAYVNGNVVQITPQISGIVVSIGADDTQFVKAGQTLVQLDQADAKVALDQAEAQLARTVRDVRSLFATSSQLQATVEVRQTEVERARGDLARREKLAASGGVSGEELQHARATLNTAEAALLVAQQDLQVNRAHIDRTTVENHPEVQNAAAKVREAYLMYARTVLPAPVSGFVAKRSVQLGQRVGPGAALMAIVPLDQVWVDANFKEPQLAAMRVGQPVRLVADIYGSKVVYSGHVEGFGAGTGSAFALLPAQNATGNWIKVVQRVPVRVALDPQELEAHPLRVGLSMEAEVDTSKRDGDPLPRVAQTAPTYATDVFRSADADADAHVASIIAENGGSPARLAQGAAASQRNPGNPGNPGKPVTAAGQGADFSHTKAAAAMRDRAL